MVLGLDVKFPNAIDCQVCMKSKCTVKPFSNSENRAKNVLEIVHTDVCGPINKASTGGNLYFLTFIDDKSRYAFVYFIKTKSEVFDKFREFKAMAERQTDRKIKILRSDNGTEFVNRTFDDFLKQTGIKRQLTVPHTPQQNGVAERFNRTLVEMARSMIVAAGVDEALWAEAIHTATYLRNRAPTRALCEKTPYEVWFKRKPNVSHLKTFGSIAIALNKKHYGKFRPKGKEYLMVGYSDESKAFRLMDKATRKIIVSRDVYFVESLPKNENIEVIIEDENANCLELKKETEDIESICGDSENEKVKNEPIEKIGPGRPRKVLTGVRGRPRKQYNVVNFTRAGNIKIPETVDEALSSMQITGGRRCKVSTKHS